MDSKKLADETPPPYPRRRGRLPKPTTHPLGRLIRDRRLAKGLSLAQLAEAVGIGPTSVSLVAAMEHGSIPPRRDIAERLAAVLEVDREPLLMWADTRVSPRTSDDAMKEREQVEMLFTHADRLRTQVDTSHAAALGSARTESRSPVRDVDALSTPVGSRRLSDPMVDQIPVLPAGADPDRYRRKPLGYLDRGAIERLIAGRAELIRPIAYELSDDDFERLRRVAHPYARPRHALVSRPIPITIDPREPYAIRLDGRVILAYCAWDGRELVVLQPPGYRGFARLRARRQVDLEEHIVGQVVTLNWWDSTARP
ncbi:MAG TPA: helix-turn-helix domain-containing protein [Vicinamibacterales bacterium]|nr:helix-turn-helix domain-containing protein [Vicinamibacterales bacterium]